MKMESKFRIVGLAAGLMLASTISVSAATVSVQANAPASWNAVDPAESIMLSAGASWTTSPSIVNDSVDGAYKSPFDPAGSGASSGSELSNWKDIQYFTVGSPAPLQGSPAKLKLSQSKSILTLLWGSIDTYNAVEFYLNGTLQDTVSGQDVFDNGGLPAASGAALVKISELANDGIFNEVFFYSNYNAGRLDGDDIPAFEFSNVIASVPLPAGGWLLITALGGMAALRRRRKVA